jgi:hypothetical protein
MKSRMNPKRKFYTALWILGGALFVSTWIILGTTHPAIDPISMLRGEKTSDNRFLFGGENGSDPLNTSDFTSNVIEKYGFHIAIQNPDGPVDKYLALPSAEKLELALQEELKKSIPYDAASESDLRVTNDTSDATVRRYLENLKNTAAKQRIDFNTDLGVALNDLTSKNDSGKLEKLATKFDSLAGDLLSVTVPGSWKVFHLELVNIHRHKAAALHALADIDNDPVKAAVAAAELRSIGAAELSLSAILSEKSKDL